MQLGSVFSYAQKEGGKKKPDNFEDSSRVIRKGGEKNSYLNAPRLKPRARPSRRVRRISSPFTSSGVLALQSHPRLIAVSPLGRGTNTPDVDPDAERAWDPSISLPMREKLLDAVREETDFLRRERGDEVRVKDCDVDGSPDDMACSE
jgi:hypothetical protein